MRLRKVCIFLVIDGLPVPTVAFDCALLDAMPEGTAVQKKMEAALGAGSEQTFPRGLSRLGAFPEQHMAAPWPAW